MNFLSTQWSTDGSTSSEPLGPCITSIIKTLTDHHTLDDWNHQGHHTTLLLSETLLSTAQASLCVGENRGLESTPSDMSRCLASLDSTWLTERGREGPPVVPAGWCHLPHLKRIIGMATAVFPWLTKQPLVWPSAVAAFTGLEPPRFLYVGIPWGQGVWQQPPDYPWPEGSNHSSNKSDPKGGMWEGHRELCVLDPNVPVGPGSSFGAHFLSASETEFFSTDLTLEIYATQVWPKVNLNKSLEVIRVLVMTVFIVSVVQTVVQQLEFSWTFIQAFYVRMYHT